MDTSDRYTDPAQSLEPVRYDIIEHLKKAVSDKDSPFRDPVVTSVDNTGRPQARVMILRDFDPSTMCLRVYTDARSPKVHDLRSNAFVQLVLYDHDARLHMRVSGTVVLHVRDELTEKLWSSLPEYGRGDYLSRKPPGAMLSDPGAFELEPELGSENFMVVEIYIHEIDWLKLSSSGHKRARLTWREGRFEGQWITP